MGKEVKGDAYRLSERASCSSSGRTGAIFCTRCTEVNPCEFEAETDSTRRRWKGNEVNDLRRER